MKTRTLVLTVIAGVGLAAATVLQARNAGGPAPRAASTAGPPTRSVAAEGRVAAYPGAEVRVAAERGGRLVRVRVEEGQRVRRGEPLAEIDAEELQAGLAQAQGRLAEAEAEATLAGLTLERHERLAAQGVLSAQDLDRARSGLDTARARVAAGRSEIERTRAQMAKLFVVAPIAGTVTLRVVDPGETVEAGDALFTVADLGRLRVEAEADEADAGVLALGAPVTVTAHGWTGQAWRGRLEDIADAVGPRRLKPQDPSRPTDTRVLALKVAFEEPTPLKLGATVEVRIEPGSRGQRPMR